MVPPPASALARVDDLDTDPVWAAALAAPACAADALTPEERAQVEAAIEDIQAGRVELVPHEEMRVALEDTRRDHHG